METNNIGGGEILQYVGQGNTSKPDYLDDSVIQSFAMLPGVKVIIMILLLVAAVLIILRLMEVRSPNTSGKIKAELDHLRTVRKRDEKIVTYNNIMRTITNIIEKSPLAMSKSNYDYYIYNLTRANVRIPGGARVMRPDEFNALIKMAQIIVCLLGVATSVFISAPLGIITIVLALFIGGTMPMTVVRNTVRTKDSEIIENFAEFYLMIHYVLLASAGTPISGIIKSYDKTTESEEMHRFCDVCLFYIDTYGEYEATRYISKQYREIPQVGKLMRLIRQANEGGDVRAELVGFRNELLAARKYAIQKRMEKLVMKAQASFNILVPILIQAIISAMAIYFDDLSLASSFL
jgi:hypothetical protein